MKPLHRTLGLAISGLPLLFAPPALALDRWIAERATGPVTVEVDNRARALEDGQTLPMRGGVELGENAALTLWRGDARIRTRGPAYLSLHGTAAHDHRIGQLHVGQGAFRIEAPDSADLRINVGGLRVRLSGSEAWMAIDPDADRVCALRGNVEVQPPDSTQTLIMRRTGACLALHTDGRLLDERPLLEELNERLARADGGVSPLPVTFQTPPLPTYRADLPQPAPLARPAKAEPPKPPAASTPLVPPRPPAAFTPLEPPGPAEPQRVRTQQIQSHYYVIIGAFSEQARANAARGVADHPHARVLRNEQATLWRLAVGPYTSRDDAERERNTLRSSYPGAWLLVVTDHHD